MYLLLFKDFGEDVERCFYFHNLDKAEKMKRELLLIEIDNLIKEDITANADVETQMCTDALQQLLNLLIIFVYKESSDDFTVTCTIEKIIFEDTIS